jgi:hypothetical protein
MRPLLIGTIERKDGMLCLRTGANVWYPLDGSSGIAERFRETFNTAQDSDEGKRLYNSRGVLQMENDAQRDARLAAAPSEDDWFKAIK